MITDLISIADKVLDKVLPDKEARDKAKLELMRLESQNELKELEVSMSAIVMEAKSQDKWTSRARPGFLYCVYLLLLSSIPMGILSAISPDTSAAIITGFQAWLAAIPDNIIALFGAGYLGYSGARSYDKTRQK